MAFFPELQFNAPKINTPFENALPIAQLQQAANQNRLAQMEFQKAERDEAQQNALAGAYRDYYAQPTQDPNMLYKTLAGAGQGAAIPGVMKNMNDAAKSGSDAEKAKIETTLKLFDAMGRIMSGVKDQASYENAVQQAAQLLGPDKVANLPREYNPELVQQKQAEALDAKTRLEERYKAMDFGLRAANQPFNPDGTPNTAFQNYAISKATAGATQNYGSPVAGVGPDGNPIFFQPSKGGGAPSIVPGIRPAPPKPVEPTGEEKTAAGYLGRMKAAEKLIGGLAGGEPTVGTSVAGAIPFVGDYTQRKVMNTKQQQYKQAADDWIRAKLRKESGAVIGDVEMKREYQTYFPQPGDEPETIKQKAMARRQAEEQMTQSAGRAAPNLTEAAFTKAETDYMAKRRAQGVPDQEIALELQQGAAKPKPAKSGGVKFLGFE